MPIRTLEHFAWAVGAASVAVLVGGLLTDWRLHIPIAIGALVGTIPALASNLPATLRIEWSLAGLGPLDAIDDCLYSAGWQKTEASKGKSIYVQRLPRWLRWRTGEIQIEEAPLAVVVRGPVIALWMLRKRLVATRSDA